VDKIAEKKLKAMKIILLGALWIIPYTSHPPTKTVHQWMGDWEDKYGNVIRYVFRYTYPKSEKKNLSNLQIHAIYTPASLVNMIKTELNKK
jgi:hypothetical protein